MEKMGNAEQFLLCVQEFKSRHKSTFSNCYMFPEEVREMVSTGRVYCENTGSALILLADEGEYYHSYIYMDPYQSFPVISMDKDIVLEYCMRVNKKDLLAESAEHTLRKAGFFRNKVSIKMQLKIGPDPDQIIHKADEYLSWLKRSGYRFKVFKEEFQREIFDLWENVLDKYDFVYGDKGNDDRNLHERQVGAVLAESGEIAAAILMRFNKGACFLSHVAVKECYRSKGLGKALMYFSILKSMESRVRSITLWVAEDNFIARHLYDEVGFLSAGQISAQLLKLQRE